MNWTTVLFYLQRSGLLSLSVGVPLDEEVTMIWTTFLFCYNDLDDCPLYLLPSLSTRGDNHGPQ